MKHRGGKFARAKKPLFFPLDVAGSLPRPPALGPRFIRCKTMNILNRVEKWIFPAARIRAIFPVKNQRERKRARRALPGISLSTRERARFIIDTVGGRTSARANARRSTGKQCTRTRVEIFYVAFFNLILQQRHVFITPLFDRGNRQRVARAIFDPTPPNPHPRPRFQLITLKSKIRNLIFRRVARPDPRGFSAPGDHPSYRGSESGRDRATGKPSVCFWKEIFTRAVYTWFIRKTFIKPCENTPFRLIGRQRESREER